MEKIKNKIDRSNLRKIIIDSGLQFEKGLKVAQKIGIKNKFDSLIICGMGGSALPGYLIESLLNLKIPVITYPNYGKPKIKGKNPLFFISSFSGNTEETLDVYKKIKRDSFKIIGFSNGGKLTELCKKDQIPCVEYDIPDSSFQPRYALPLVFAAMTKVLENSDLFQGADKTIRETANFMKKLNQSTLEEETKKIARKIKNRIPIFYSDYDLRYAVMINKIKINENSKLPAFWNYFPELNHNEFNGYLNGQPQSFQIISFFNKKAHPQNKKRIQITNKILTDLKYNVILINVKGGNLIENFFYVLNYGDWIAYSLALLIGQDPTPVIMVEKLKEKLKKA